MVRFYNAQQKKGQDGQRNMDEINLITDQVSPTPRGEHGVEEACVQAGGQDQEARHQADPRCLRQEADGGADDLDFVLLN